MDPRLADGRGRPIWTVDDRESRVTPLDLQVRCVLKDIKETSVIMHPFIQYVYI